jgi:hypothetical protein
VVQQTGQRQGIIAISGPPFLCRNYLPLLKLALGKKVEKCAFYAGFWILSHPRGFAVLATMVRRLRDSMPERESWSHVGGPRCSPDMAGAEESM